MNDSQRKYIYLNFISSESDSDAEEEEEGEVLLYTLIGKKKRGRCLPLIPRRGKRKSLLI
jgi:hypothetical protein